MMLQSEAIKQYFSQQGWKEINVDTSRFVDEGIPEESLLVGEAGGLANVIVWVLSENVPVQSIDEALSPVHLRVQDGRYKPRMNVFDAWRLIVLDNADPVSHPFRVQVRNSSPIHIMVPAMGEAGSTNRRLRPAMTKQAPRLEPQPHPMPLTDSMHTWMRGWVLPLPHP